MKYIQRQRSTRSLRSLAAVTLAASILTACGGGGGGGDSNGGDGGSLALSALQGRWESTGAAPAQTAIVVPAASGTGGAVWLLRHDGSALGWLEAGTTGSDTLVASGSTYPLTGGNAAPQPLSWNGSFNLAANSLSINGGALQLTRTDKLASASSLADVTGNWSATFSSGAVVMSLGIAGNGSISGQGTTGCTYSGQLAGRSDARVFDATLAENCNGNLQNFSGIGTYRIAAAPGASSLTLAMRNQDGSAATVLLLAR